jgi:hypothetical protein
LLMLLLPARDLVDFLAFTQANKRGRPWGTCFKAGSPFRRASTLRPADSARNRRWACDASSSGRRGARSKRAGRGRRLPRRRGLRAPPAPDRSHEPAAPALRQQPPRAPDARQARSPSDPGRGFRRSSPLRPLPRSEAPAQRWLASLRTRSHTEAMWRSAFASFEATASSSATSQPRHTRYGRSRDASVPRRPATGPVAPPAQARKRGSALARLEGWGGAWLGQLGPEKPRPTTLGHERAACHARRQPAHHRANSCHARRSGRRRRCTGAA